MHVQRVVMNQRHVRVARKAMFRLLRVESLEHRCVPAGLELLPLQAVGDTAAVIAQEATPLAEPVIAVAAAQLTPALEVVAPVAETAAPLVGTVADSVAPLVEPVADAVAPLVESVADAVAPLTEPLVPVVEAVAPVVEPLAPVVEAVAPVVEAVAPVVAPVTGPLAPALEPVLEPVGPVVGPVVDPVLPVIDPVAPDVPPLVPQPDTDDGQVEQPGPNISGPDDEPTTGGVGGDDDGVPATLGGPVVFLPGPVTGNDPTDPTDVQDFEPATPETDSVGLPAGDALAFIFGGGSVAAEAEAAPGSAAEAPTAAGDPGEEGVPTGPLFVSDDVLATLPPLPLELIGPAAGLSDDFFPPEPEQALAATLIGEVAEGPAGLSWWLAALAALAVAYELARRDLKRLRAAAAAPLPESAAFPPAEQP
jgi:hypothetical protein